MPSSMSRLSTSAPTTSQELQATVRGRPSPFNANGQHSFRDTSGAMGDDPRRLPSEEVQRRHSTGQSQSRHNDQHGSTSLFQLTPPLPEGHKDDRWSKSMLADWSRRPRTHELIALGIPHKPRDTERVLRDFQREFDRKDESPRRS